MTTTTTTARPVADRARLLAEVANAARIVPPVWPLGQFIAVNPLQGLVDLGFEQATAEARKWLGAATFPSRAHVATAVRSGRITADDVAAALAEHAAAAPDVHDAHDDEVDGVLRALGGDTEADARQLPAMPRTAAERYDARHATSVAATVDERVAAVCAAYAGSGAAWAGPTDRGFWSWWSRGDEPAADGLLDALDRIGLAPGDHADELRGQLSRLPGWAGFARWCDEWAAGDAPVRTISLIDYLAVRMTVEADALEGQPDRPLAPLPRPRREPSYAPSEPAGLGERVTDHALDVIALEAYERNHRMRLLDELSRSWLSTRAANPSAAQVVFCIDTRSEVFRRHLEAVGPYQTIGFAGFFGVPLRFRPAGSDASFASCPVLVTPDVEVTAQPATRALRRKKIAASASAARQQAKAAPGAAFAFAEASGLVEGPLAAARTFLRRRTKSAAGDAIAVLDVDGFGLEARAAIAETALRTMGLTDGFAPLVVLCGHGSTSTANPHFASLDCGACGGNRGGPNARVAATFLNDADVRVELAARGIHIPDTTFFAAAEHDTTLDTVTVFDVAGVPPTHADALKSLLAAVEEAAEATRLERGGRLGVSARDARRPWRRALDWASVRPEWGLAGNAAFIVADRNRTAGADLEGRAFLHSYDRDADAEGTALETILTAPMVVAHWINSQYYFSTVDPDVYGAGDKTLHNPIGAVGVLAGPSGDLRIGLPRQSVFAGDSTYHEPMRLLTVVDAPVDRIESVIARNAILRHLFDGRWVTLVAAPASVGAPWLRRRPGGEWVPA
ncbi:MAG TPA: DUF2309 domain-containing protein [Acidimicrobiales bacterium]|nr:DUF2309 domain-containing protein [Acidimicrobiales bacterium]